MKILNVLDDARGEKGGSSHSVARAFLTTSRRIPHKEGERGGHGWGVARVSSTTEEK